jgi:hypothetical protein
MTTTARNLGPGINLLNPFVGVSDYGTKTVQVTPGGGEEAPYDETKPRDAYDYLIDKLLKEGKNNPLYDLFIGDKGKLHTDTYVTETKTPDGKRMFTIAGKTGGPNRERYVNTFVEDNKGNLVPMGQGEYYKGSLSSLDRFVNDAAKAAAAAAAIYFGGPIVMEALGATGAGTGAVAAGEGVLAGTTAADIMAATEALEAAGAATLGGSAGLPTALGASELAAAGAGAGVPAALGSAAPASVTVAGSSLPAATSITPGLAAAGVLGGAALAGGASGTTPDVVDEYNVTGGQGTQIPGGGSLGAPATVATTAAGASILKQLADATGLSEDTLRSILKGGAGLLTGYASYRDAEAAREAARGKPFKSSSGYQAVTGAGGVTGFKKAASGGIISLQGGGGVSSLTPVVNDPIAYMNDVSNALLTMQEGRLRDPKLYETVLSGMNLRNTDKLFNEIARNPDELSDRDYYLMEAFGLPALASMPPSDSLVSAVDRIRGLSDSASTPTPSQISMYEANELYAPGGQGVFDSGSAALSPSKDYGDAFSEEYNPTLEKMMREFEKTGHISGVDSTAEDEEGLGSSYSGLMALLAPKMGEDVTQMRASGGGIGSLEMARGGRALPPRYLDGHSDGMADKVPAHIDNKRPAALSDGEFVIPADVVSHLGNGNSNAGAKRLYKMMDRIRAARTGNRKQGRQINPDKFLPR